LLKQTDIFAKALPRESSREYDKFAESKSGGYEISNARYKTRVRPSKQVGIPGQQLHVPFIPSVFSRYLQSLVILTDHRGREYQGRAHQAQGKTTRVKFGDGQQPTGPIQNIRVIGQDDPTNSERARNAVLLKILQGDINLVHHDFIRYLWFPTAEDTWSLGRESYNEGNGLYERIVRSHSLNASQQVVVKGMISSRPMVIVHGTTFIHLSRWDPLIRFNTGPPGTGKTTTIAAAAAFWSNHKQPVWIVGHSNISVKNIAEKLWKKGVHFKILVSKEFYVEWCV